MFNRFVLLYVFQKTSPPGRVIAENEIIKRSFNALFRHLLDLQAEAIASNNEDLHNALKQIQISLVDMFKLQNAKARAYYKQHKEDKTLVDSLTDSFDLTFHHLWEEKYSFPCLSDESGSDKEPEELNVVMQIPKKDASEDENGPEDEITEGESDVEVEIAKKKGY